ncbi:Panacea domain-containing protein [uncultured Roseovarius sp.]|uniref:Panacea domain-containing protein n=1 Tax=uncultured Roseovarius sp. TaxID=293344 RepID=UPI00262C1DFC|nr:Panacea domain-containing protein [uncultured Roseovarius sp.]
MKPNVDRILAALCHVIKEARDRKRDVSQYDLVKTLFLADRSHLNEWGRPITYDNYTAMKHGPVPSLAYDLLKANVKSLRDHKISQLPWKAVHAGGSKKHFFPLKETVNEENYLSLSDIEALDDALGMVLSLGFSQIRRLTHEDQAYIDAWREDGGKAAYDMKLGLLFDEPNFEQAEILAEYSPYV